MGQKPTGICPPSSREHGEQPSFWRILAVNRTAFIPSWSEFSPALQVQHLPCIHAWPPTTITTCLLCVYTDEATKGVLSSSASAPPAQACCPRLSRRCRPTSRRPYCPIRSRFLASLLCALSSLTLPRAASISLCCVRCSFSLCCPLPSHCCCRPQSQSWCYLQSHTLAVSYPVSLFLCYLRAAVFAPLPGGHGGAAGNVEKVPKRVRQRLDGSAAEELSFLRAQRALWRAAHHGAHSQFGLVW